MREKNNQIIMTSGKPLGIIVRFSIPLILSAFFSQLYSFIDSMIVGRCISEEALAAVNLTTSLNWFIMGISMGSALGFCIPFGQSVGASDKKMYSKYFYNGLYLSILISVLLTIIFVPNTYNLLVLINTPDNLIAMSTKYLVVVFASLILTTMYHFFAGIMRSLGNSKQPFYFMLAGNILNICLDLLFINMFKMGVQGAAIATALSQLFTVALCIFYTFKKMNAIDNSQTKIDKDCIKTLVTIGMPMGLELSVNAIGSVILQGCVNQLGSVVVTAVAAGEKIRSMITLPLENLGSAMSTYTAQNYGAKNKERIVSGIKACVLILVGYCVFAYLLVFILKKPLAGLLLGDVTTEAGKATVEYLGLISTLFVAHGTLQIFRNILQGMGHSVPALMSGVFEIIGRVIGGSLAVYYISFEIVCFANPMAWVLAGAYCVIMTIFYLKRIKFEN